MTSLDNPLKRPHVMLHQIQTQIMVHDQRKRRNPAFPGKSCVSPVGGTRFPIITRIIKTWRCSRTKRQSRRIMSTPPLLKKTTRSRPYSATAEMKLTRMIPMTCGTVTWYVPVLAFYTRVDEYRSVSISSGRVSHTFTTRMKHTSFSSVSRD